MKMRSEKILIVGMILSLFVIPSILADTDIEIQTLKDHRISIIIREAGELSTIESFHKDTNNGNITLSTTTTKSSLDIIVTLNKLESTGIEKILNRKFEEIDNEEPIFIRFIPGDIDIFSGEEADLELNPPKEEEVTANVTEETDETTTEESNEEANETEPITTTETTEQEASQITGFSVKGVVTSKKTLYGFITIVIIALVLVAVIHFRKKLNSDNLNFGNLDAKPSSLIGPRTRMADPQNTSRLASAEKKLKEAQDEISIIKNKEDSKRKLREAEEKIRRDKEELRKLQSGG